jgi:GAF domain-containing protein
MRAGLLSLLLRPTAQPLNWGLVVAASLIVAATPLLYPLERVAPENALGVVYLLGVVVVAIGWGFWLAAATSVASALAFDYFHIPPVGSLMVTQPQDRVALLVFLAVALVASWPAHLARSRAAEAGQHRREVEASRDELGVLAEHQGALRRVATLVARGASPSDVFAAVADELARCLHVVNAGLLRYEADGTGFVVAVQYEPGITEMPAAGERIPLGGDDVGVLVLGTGRAARIDNHEDTSGPEAARIRAEGIRSIVGVPVIVNGRLWGAAIVGSRRPEPMPPDTEARIGDLADLVATAIANAATRAELQASRDELGVLAGLQASLRQIATLVAHGVPPSEVFSAVVGEVSRCLEVQHSVLFRYEPDGAAFLVAACDEDPGVKKMPVGERLSLEGESVVAMVSRTGRAAWMVSYENAPGSVAARMRDLGLRAAVGAPIVVDGRLGCGHRRLVATGALAARHRDARRRLRGSCRDRDCQRRGPRATHRVSGPDRGGRRRCPAPYRTRSARRRPAAAGLARAAAARHGGVRACRTAAA